MKYETLNKVDSFLDKILREFISVFLKSFMLTPKVLIIILIVVVMLPPVNIISELISQWSQADLTLQISLIQKMLALCWTTSFVACALCTLFRQSRRHKTTPPAIKMSEKTPPEWRKHGYVFRANR